ncbi:peroxiredoxin [Flavobacterium sp. HSC-61S13]|uniref:peroxiredoxin family protein n=1 Tax=Flavobacterium sp. HSC-61S13 TaxID=2910963 RepID=UPI00209F89EB|nr:hypothetical protein [Flavobacterium sp. HSC-61S13]MCP1997437.1 hypothetical protein [Flavobacterium sp. HSC-61S13]
MKKIFCLFLVLAFFLSCKNKIKDSKEDVYIKTNLSKILNLNESDRSDFKKTMVFDSNGKLSSWNIDLLEKAYVDEDDFTNVFAFLISDLGGDTSKMIIVDENSNERVLYPKFKSLNSKKYSLDEVKNMNALFYITSTNCGGCVSEYNNMNILASKFKDKNIKFIAVFENVNTIENYKKGAIYKKNGFINDDWIILELNNLLPVLTKKYKNELGFPFAFFRKNNLDLDIYPNPHDYQSIEKIIREKF